jgi:hypothetical protein
MKVNLFGKIIEADLYKVTETPISVPGEIAYTANGIVCVYVKSIDASTAGTATKLASALSTATLSGIARVSDNAISATLSAAGPTAFDFTGTIWLVEGVLVQVASASVNQAGTGIVLTFDKNIVKTSTNSATLVPITDDAVDADGNGADANPIVNIPAGNYGWVILV